MVYILKNIPDYLTEMSAVPEVKLSSAEARSVDCKFYDLAFPEHGSFDIVFPELCIVWSLGPMQIRFGGKTKNFAPEFERPRLFLPGHSHYGDWQGSSNNLSLDMSRSFIESSIHKSASADAVDQIVRRSSEIEYLFQILRNDIAAEMPAGPMLSEALMNCVISHLWPDDDYRKRLEERSGGTAIRRSFEEIEACLPERLTLDRLAKTAGLSTRHFCRAFRDALGCPPHEYIIRRRVEEARKLIGAGKLNLVEVAETVGFSSQSHMTSAFKRVIGVTPSTFKPTR